MSDLRINKEIKAKQVRIVNTDNPGIYNFSDALKLAYEQNLDLVEINSTTNPPVCKILDYQKYLYQQKKKAKEMKANQVQIETKEIRLSYNIGDNDLLTKEKQAIKFLEDGNKVLLSMLFKGRTIAYVEQGKAKISQFINDIDCEIEKDIVLNNNKLTSVIKAKKK